MEKYPWRDEQWLYKQYVVEGKGMAQIADEVATSSATIHDWINRHGIESRSNELSQDHPIQDETKLRRLHHDKEWNVNKIANEYNVSRDAVKRRLEKFGIERHHHERDKYGQGVFFYTSPDGYEKCGASNRNESTTVRFHKLHACLKHDPHEVFKPDTSIHHKNRVRWDNRLENLQVMSLQEHSKLHSDAGDLHNLDEEGYND